MPAFTHPTCPTCRKSMQLVATGTQTYFCSEGSDKPLPDKVEYRIFSCAACVQGMSVDYCPEHGEVLELQEKNYDFETRNPTGGPGHITRQRKATCSRAGCTYGVWHQFAVR